MEAYKTKILVVLSVCLFVFQFSLNVQAQETAIIIKSRAEKQNPKIVIRSDYDFEKQISLKVKPDPRFLPTDALIRTISRLGIYDARGVRITAGFDIDSQNDLVLAFSGGTSQIIKSSANPSGFTITANFKDNKGNYISPPRDSIALYTTSGEKLCFEYKDVKKAAPKIAFVLLLDRSGSMVDVISDVQDSASRFLKELPASAECALASFNDTYAYHHKNYENCNCGDFGLNTLEAGGQTDIYTPLLGAYESLSQEYFKDYQKAVILITDGQIPPDPEMKKELFAAKKDILTFVYFLGEKNDHELIGLADAFLQTTSDIKSSLEGYFHSLSTAYGSQKVLEVRPCNGGKS